MQTSQSIRDAADQLKEIDDASARLKIFERAAKELDLEARDQYELDATCLAVARDDTSKFAQSILSAPQQPDSETRFLVFAAGAISCRRAEDRGHGEELLELVRGEFAEIPLFKHFDALALEGGNKRQLRRGLALEQGLLEEDRGRLHPGGAHLIARFILQLSECDQLEEGDFKEALDSVNEAIEGRPGYAKFFATRAAIYMHLGRFDDARDDLLQAIRLEDRSSNDARERVAEYKFERRAIELYRTLHSVTEQAQALEDRSRKTTERLRGAELSVISAVAFIAAILSLIQVTLNNVNGRPLGDSLIIVGSFAVILFGAVAFGAWLLRRPWRSLAQTTSRETPEEID